MKLKFENFKIEIGFKNQELVEFKENHYRDFTGVYTDGSKHNQKTGFGVIIPEYNINLASRGYDNIRIYTVEMLAIHIAQTIIIENSIQ